MKTAHKAIVFDFDGVIVPDSDQVKSNTWPQVLQPYGPKALVLLDEAHQRFGRGKGGDRFDILRYIYTQLGDPAGHIEGLVAASAKQFDLLAQEGILRSGVNPQMRAALEHLAEKFPLYVNTATPVEAIQKTIDALGLRDFFVGVLGRPKSKVENFRLVASEQKVASEEILFVGDSDTDAKAAQEFGCAFIGFGNDLTNDWLRTKQEFRVISVLGELEDA